MSFDLYVIQPFLLIMVFWLLVLPLLSKANTRHRTIVVVFTLLFSARYFIWRLRSTVLPFEGGGTEKAWVWIVFAFEVLAFIETALFLVIMSRTNNRSQEADRYAAEMTVFPSVDVFIPTYDEGLDVLEKSILGCKHLDYPNFKVWVLDDTRRPWLRDFCAAHDVGYLTRADNAHAKAGNLNSALGRTSGELIAVFDADFVPCRNFLRRTTGFFGAEPDIGLVQTPQHYFNRDPIQLNLGMGRLLPDEQRLFFDAMAPSRDGWGAAFCCGSCSVIRRKALDQIGGIPTSSITEDLLTTLALLTVKYRTVYLNETLSHGMSSESLRGYFIQRARWCRGGIQCFWVKEGPLRAPGLTFFQRLLFSPYSWLIQSPTRFMLLAIPLMYLWFDLLPFHSATSAEVIYFQFPLFLVYLMAMHYLVGRKYVPFISSAVNVFGMFRLFPVVVSSLIKPFGVPFRVTPKGSASHSGVDWYVFGAASTIIILSLAGLSLNSIPEYRIIRYSQDYSYVLFWTVMNVLLLLFSLLLCFDAPRRRLEERFAVDEKVGTPSGEAELAELSLNGALIRGAIYVPGAGSRLELSIAGVSGKVTAKVVRPRGPGAFAVSFEGLTPGQREELIVKLFTGKYENEIGSAAEFSSLFKALVSRAFGREAK